MQRQDFVLYLLASVVLLTIASSMIRARTFRDRIHYFLFLILYGSLTALWILDSQKPAWVFGSQITLFSLGGLWFLIDPLIQTILRKRLAKSELRDLKKEKGSLYEVVAACRLLSEAKVGALIALERQASLKEWIEKAVTVDAAVSRELLFSVFSPECPLHDGAAVIQRDRLAACGVIAPLSFSTEFPKELGTRHRAAIGFSETIDVLCIVVSEETGSISLADRGSLYYDIPFEKLPEFLNQAMRFRLPKKALLQTCEVVRA